MWHRHAHTRAPLTKLCYTKFISEWIDVEQKAFMTMKNFRKRRVDIISYFSEEFIIHTDASKTQLGEVISLQGKPTVHIVLPSTYKN